MVFIIFQYSNIINRVNMSALREIKRYDEACTTSFLINISLKLTHRDKIYMKYLFGMDQNITYRYIFAALNSTTTVTKSMVIEAFFITKKWNELFTFFNLDILNRNHCFIVTQFTNIPINR
ncbi:hypothetical protein MRV_0032 [Murid herpesvirus 3]|uniref:Uncharacterized protein n=2 Tax=Murid betaherpesvirus 3 TaxID=2560603 RepID=A0A1P8VIR8_9BETA|nr:hypothetical protein MRV_0032 [Murine roseolovirus]APZ76243.1 hypothetical protein MRV_0032 [Murid betaherpesvirus 3]AYH64805.1 hypothetical protein MRV_0032 [Murid herpesvirus 3]